MDVRKRNVYDFTLGILSLGLLLSLSFIQEGITQIDSPLFLLLIAAGLILQRIELRISDFTITFDVCVMIASYFILGFLPTLWLITIMFFSYKLTSKTISMGTIFSNTGMFVFIFVIIHFLFKSLGYEYSRSFEIANAVKTAIFSLILFLLNWMFIFLRIKISSRNLPISWFESFKWDFYGSLVAIPMSVMLITGYYYYNYIGILVLSLLILLVNFSFKILRNLVFLNNELRVVHEASVSISGNLELCETTLNIIDGIYELVRCDFCSVLKFDTERMIVETMDSKIFGDMEVDNISIENYMEDILQGLINHKKSFIENKSRINKMILDPEKISKNFKSILYEPLVVQDELIGCLLICSEKHKSFLKEHLIVLNILANQAAIAIENARMYKETKNRAIKDSLTGVFNQSYFFSALDAITGECELCDKEKCTTCRMTSLIIFDIDFFKQVNDTYGHQTGDKILRDVIEIIKGNVRKSDIVSRYGGEEFTVILPQTDEDTAFSIADRIRQIIEDTLFITVRGKSIRITISGGVSEFPKQADSGSSLLAYADRAMYIGSKRQGRNKISKYIS